MKILSVERTAVPDQLLVTGTVEGYTHDVLAPTADDPERVETVLAPVSVTVWESHLYGEPVDPKALDADGRYERAPDKLGGAEGDTTMTPRAPVHAEEGAGPRDPGIPTTDKQRKAYLREQLVLAAQGPAPASLDHLAD